ncbi:hypothetical protein ABZ208_00725 [Streptomyces sp. NPDC006208]|uniref:hypothetical protein n=1 Tax=Streptomyces sp. NPDC006208 TaxID=3156734 RepID=UPI00339F4E01
MEEHEPEYGYRRQGPQPPRPAAPRRGERLSVVAARWLRAVVHGPRRTATIRSNCRQDGARRSAPVARRRLGIRGRLA